MNLKKLPHWCITDIFPAFYDFESLTSIEQTARLYASMQGIIEGCNKYSEELNKTIEEFINTFDNSVFEKQINKIIHDYLDYMDNKIVKQDKVINDAITYMTNNLTSSIREIINEMKESGELNSELLTSIDNINSRLTTLENKVITKVSQLENDSNFATKDYVDNEIATFDFIKIVDPLPEVGLENRLYLVPKTTPNNENKDLFDEYMWVNDKWEFITTKQIEVDLTQYYKKTEVYNKEESYSKDEVYSKEESYSKDEVYSKEEAYNKNELYSKYELYNKSEVDRFNTYSTEETFTGKYWIDGKKIYRKIIETTSSQLQNLLNTMSIETVTYMFGEVNASYDTSWFINSYPSDEQNNYKFGIRRKTSTSQFVVSYGSAYSDSSSLYLVLEYTKTSN